MIVVVDAWNSCSSGTQKQASLMEHPSRPTKSGSQASAGSLSMCEWHFLCYIEKFLCADFFLTSNPKCTRFASSSKDGIVRIWNADTRG